jgi:hypothetical protein
MYDVENRKIAGSYENYGVMELMEFCRLRF